MTSHPALPESWHCISHVGIDGSTLSLRLLPESLIPAEAKALVVSICDALDAQNALAFLAAVQERGDFVGLSWEKESLCIETEFGEELSILAASFAAAHVEPTVAELRIALQASEATYLRTHQELRQVTKRLRLVQEMLTEQNRRIEVKASGHLAESTVGVLYLQQAEFIARLQRATEA